MQAEKAVTPALTSKLYVIRGGLRRVIKWITYGAGVALVVMTALIVVNVVARYILRKPLMGANEVGQLMLVMTAFFAVSFTESVKSHVSFDEVVKLFPKKIKNLTTATMYFIAGVYFGTLSWREAVLGISYLSPTVRQTDVLHIPLAPFAFIITIGACILALELLLDAFLPAKEREKRGELE